MVAAVPAYALAFTAAAPYPGGDAAGLPSVDHGTEVAVHEAASPEAFRPEAEEDRNMRVVVAADGAAELCPLAAAVEKLLEHEPQRRVPAKAVLFEHHFLDRPVMYGGWFGRRRAPAVFLEAPCEEVLAYVQDDPEGPFVRVGEEQHWETFGFAKDKQESMFKLDWHTVPHLGPQAELFVPRAAKRGRLPRAPPRILAFIMAFRAVNQACWSAIVATLQGLKLAREAEDPGYGDSARGKLLGTLIECFKNSRHLGVVEAQVRWGEKDRRMPSHKDGATSLLHLGLTIGGRRTFRAGVFEASHAEGNSLPRRTPVLAKGTEHTENDARERNVWDEEVWPQSHLKEILMTPGAAYLSSPFLFEHAVEYDTASDKERPIIALQCRFAYPEDLGRHLNDLRDDDVAEIAAVVTEVLKTSSEFSRLRMPTLGEVVQGEAQVRRILEAEAEEEERKRQAQEERKQQKREEKRLKEERAEKAREEQRAYQAMIAQGWLQYLASQPSPVQPHWST